MKIASILLCIFSVLYNTHQKPLSAFDYTNLSYEKIFIEIEQQTDHSFAHYETKETFELTIYRGNARIDDVFSITSGDQPLVYCCEHPIVNSSVKEVNCDCDCNFNKGSNKYLIEVNGKVMNEKGELIEGVPFYRKRSINNSIFYRARTFLDKVIETGEHCNYNVIHISTCLSTEKIIYYSNQPYCLRNPHRKAIPYYRYRGASILRLSKFFPGIAINTKRVIPIKDPFNIIIHHSGWKRFSPIFHTA